VLTRKSDRTVTYQLGTRRGEGKGGDIAETVRTVSRERREKPFPLLKTHRPQGEESSSQKVRRWFKEEEDLVAYVSQKSFPH